MFYYWWWPLDYKQNAKKLTVPSVKVNPISASTLGFVCTSKWQTSTFLKHGFHKHFETTTNKMTRWKRNCLHYFKCLNKRRKETTKLEKFPWTKLWSHLPWWGALTARLLMMLFTQTLYFCRTLYLFFYR